MPVSDTPLITPFQFLYRLLRHFRRLPPPLRHARPRYFLAALPPRFSPIAAAADMLERRRLPMPQSPVAEAGAMLILLLLSFAAPQLFLLPADLRC